MEGSIDQVRQKKPLRAKAPLRRTPKKPKKRKTIEQKTASELVKAADREFSRYIRLRDSVEEGGAWVGVCITCPRKLVIIDADGKWRRDSQNGHYISRGFHQLRYDEENCSLQCSHCNAWRDKVSMTEAYTKAVDDKYGDGTANKLKAWSEQDGARKMLTKPELLQVIADSKKQVEFMLDSN